jgi:hypothetical protein
MTHEEGPFTSRPFDHRQHLKFAWSVLEEMPTAEAAHVVGSEIREFAAVHAPGKYHATLTQFWVRLVAHTRAHGDPDMNFEDHLARFPILLNTSAHKHHYSPSLLGWQGARENFVEPDLVPMP